MAKHLSKDKTCLYVGANHNGLGEECVVQDDVKRIKDDETYLVSLTSGRIAIVNGSELMPK